MSKLFANLERASMYRHFNIKNFIQKCHTSMFTNVLITCQSHCYNNALRKMKLLAFAA